MIHFECDYAEGAHEKIMHRLLETNLEQTSGYGMDEYCQKATKLIKEACNAKDSDIHFLVGGTQANKVMIASILRPHQGVISAQSGHIANDEAGAIEATGHKIITLPCQGGKIKALDILSVYEKYWNDPSYEHKVQPGLIYISHPTENGILYTKKELKELNSVAKKCDLPLIMDGARLGYALASPGNDLSLADIAELCDMFYIGGTKVGALFGEAVVISNNKYKKDFRSIIKQNGAMLAKGRLLGIQFETLFTDNLYLEISKNAVSQALKIKKAFQDKSVPLLHDSVSNQQFVILTTEQKNKLKNKYLFSSWGQQHSDTENSYRFCTSWATKAEDVDELIADIKKL